MPDHLIEALREATGAEDVDALIAATATDAALTPIGQAIADALANLADLDALLNAEGAKAGAVELHFDSGADGTGEPDDHAAYARAATAMNSVERLYGQRQLVAGHLDTLLNIYRAAADRAPAPSIPDHAQEN